MRQARRRSDCAHAVDLFALTAILISLGALFAVAIIAPLALSFARKHRINQFMVGLLVVHGALAGAFSPISVYGIFINDYLARNGLTPTPVSLFFAPLIFNVVFALVVYIVLRRRPGLRAEVDDAPSARNASSDIESSETGSSGTGNSAVATSTIRLTLSHFPTLIGLIAMALSVLIFGWDVGIVTITIAVVLTFINPASGSR